MKLDTTHVAGEDVPDKLPEDADSVPELPPASPAPWYLRQPVIAAVLLANVPLVVQLLEADDRLLAVVGLAAVNAAAAWIRSKVTPTRDPQLAPGVPLRVPE